MALGHSRESASLLIVLMHALNNPYCIHVYTCIEKLLILHLVIQLRSVTLINYMYYICMYMNMCNYNGIGLNDQCSAQYVNLPT